MRKKRRREARNDVRRRRYLAAILPTTPLALWASLGMCVFRGCRLIGWKGAWQPCDHSTLNGKVSPRLLTGTLWAGPTNTGAPNEGELQPPAASRSELMTKLEYGGPAK
jgi:hypothetical protein